MKARKLPPAKHGFCEQCFEPVTLAQYKSWASRECKEGPFCSVACVSRFFSYDGRGDKGAPKHVKDEWRAQENVRIGEVRERHGWPHKNQEA